MKVNNASISILVSEDVTRIEIYDNDSSTQFCTIKLTAEQLSKCLSRLAHVKCEASVHGLDKINKKMENDRFSFLISKEVNSSRNVDVLNNLAAQAMQDTGFHEWVSDGTYGSQQSFHSIGDKYYASVIIRRWI